MIARRIQVFADRSVPGPGPGLAPACETPRAPRPRLTLLAGHQLAEDTPAASRADQFEAELVRQTGQLRRYALRLCNNASLAEDLIQDTLLNAWLARDRFQQGTNLKAWCTTILRNVFFSYKRRSWRILPLSDETMANLPSRTAEGGGALDLLAVRNAIALLPPEQREALLLIGAGGLSYAEAAGLCDCAIGTVKSRVSRARIRLSALISENRAGFSTDPNIGADSALNDLLDQVAQITGRASVKSVRCNPEAEASGVHSEPALLPSQVLAILQAGSVPAAG